MSLEMSLGMSLAISGATTASPPTQRTSNATYATRLFPGHCGRVAACAKTARRASVWRRPLYGGQLRGTHRRCQLRIQLAGSRIAYLWCTPCGYFNFSRGLHLLAQTDVQVAQLSFIHGTGRLGQQTLRALRLGEGDHVADGFRTGHHGHDTIQPERQATMRWRAVLQCVEQETKLELRFFRADVERAEHLRLHRLLMDTDRAATDFRTVQGEVVGLRQTFARIAFQQRKMFVLGGGERVMASVPTLGFLVVFEHREIHHPQRFPCLTVGVTLVVSDPGAQRAERVVDDFFLVRTEENNVAIPRAGSFDDGAQCRFVEVLHDRRLQASF